MAVYNHIPPTTIFHQDRYMASLTVRTVQALIKAGEPGKYGDGRGLYLKVPPKGEPYWMLRYTIGSKRREITLGKVY
ncbi:Arm DNA-binding domain-containing protein [Serratia symbiotica]|uniref:Arm DNA-binding domain-containing protein n=1 Tax=Serratia symbiotica TaxID=138074 RepID=UPI003013F64B